MKGDLMDVTSSRIDLNTVLRLREDLKRIDGEIQFWTDVIEDYSHHEDGGGGQSFSNPKENPVVARLDAIAKLDRKREDLTKAERVLTERIASLDVRSEVRRATRFFYVGGMSLDHIGRVMNYSKTQIHRMKEEGKEAYEDIYV